MTGMAPATATEQPSIDVQAGSMESAHPVGEGGGSVAALPAATVSDAAHPQGEGGGSAAALPGGRGVE